MSNRDKSCAVASDCRVVGSGDERDGLFKDNWEVFVIRQDTKTGRFDWFTECCERIVNRFRHEKELTSTACC